MYRILVLVILSACLLACGAPDTTLRATSMPNPTNVPATPGPSPTPVDAYPAPYPAPLAIAAAPDPRLSARWDSATSATIQWTQAQRGCLYRLSAIQERGFVGCYEQAGTITITLGHVGPLSGDLRPTSGDVYILVTNGQQYRAPLIGRAQYLAAWR